MFQKTTTRSEASLEKGIGFRPSVRGSGFGEVYVALDSTSKDLVAIKKVKLVADSEQIKNETRMLKSCVSRFIVRYNDVLQSEGELWVCCCLSE